MFGLFLITSIIFLFSCNQNIDTNTDSIQEIQIKSLPDKTDYLKDETLDLSGLKVISKSKNGNKTEITDYTTTPKNGTQLSTLGQIKIEVSYQNFKTSFKINVLPSDFKLPENSIIDLYQNSQLSTNIEITKTGNLDVNWYRKLPNQDNYELIDTANNIPVSEGDNYICNLDLPQCNFLECEYYSEYTLKTENETLETRTSNICKVVQQINTGLQLVNINTVNSETPTCEYVSAPAGENGGGITNATKVPGKLTISKNNEILYDSGEYIKDTSGMTIKIRGNTSAYTEKKPYKIKLSKKEDLLFRNNSNYKDKEWLLLKDGNSINTAIGFMINDFLGHSWTPAYEYVDLVLNGEYKGTYILTESIKQNKKGRINVADDGFIFEYDAYWWNEDQYITTKNGRKYTFKYPDDELTQEQITYITNAISDMEDSIYNETYLETIDINSFVYWILGHDILGDNDPAGSNIYLSKFDSSKTSKIQMSTLWDFDGIFMKDKDFSTIHSWGPQRHITVTKNSEGFYYPLLLNSEVFYTEYISTWENLSPNLVAYMDEQLDSFQYKYENGLDLSNKLNSIRWNKEYSLLETNITKAKNWFTVRKNWLDKEIQNITLIRPKINESKTELSVLLKTKKEFSTFNIAVWSYDNGQDDLNWYSFTREQTKKENDSYSFIIPLQNFTTNGEYAVHVYGIKNAGSQEFITACNFQLQID